MTMIRRKHCAVIVHAHTHMDLLLSRKPKGFNEKYCCWSEIRKTLSVCILNVVSDLVQIFWGYKGSSNPA